VLDFVVVHNIDAKNALIGGASPSANLAKWLRKIYQSSSLMKCHQRGTIYMTVAIVGATKEGF
jgi:hypothetical protein